MSETILLTLLSKLHDIFFKWFSNVFLTFNVYITILPFFFIKIVYIFIKLNF